MTTFNNLPQHVQDEIKSVLSAYDRCTVEKTQDNQYKVMTCTVLHNSTYNEFIGEFTKDEIFTKEEQIINYVKSFRDFPYPEYTGTKDWQALNSNWTNVTMDSNNNLVFS